jgi:hypothetical protein
MKNMIPETGQKIEEMKMDVVPLTTGYQKEKPARCFGTLRMPPSPLPRSR